VGRRAGLEVSEKKGEVMYEGVSKIFRTDAVKTINITNKRM
jgi:hypothetical protein